MTDTTPKSDGDNFTGRPWHLAGGVVLLLVLIAIVYWPAIGAGIIWDDFDGYAGNPLLHTWEGLRRIWMHPPSLPLDGHYYPLVLTGFWLEHQLSGGSVLVPHVTNIVLHAANALFIWAILRRLSVPGAWLAAAVWTLHPLQVESVAWIYERKNTLSFFFWLWAAWVWMPLATRWSWRRYAAVCVLFVCALLSKTSSVTLAPVLAILHWWMKDRLDRRDLAALASLFLAAFAFGLFDMFLFTARSPWDYGLTFANHLVLFGKTFWFYIGKLICPIHLMPIYPKWNLDAVRWTNWLFPLTAVLFLALIAVRWRKGDHALTAGTLYFLAALGPFLGLIEYNYFGTSYAADHLLYQASPGPIALACAAAVRGYRQLRLPQWAGTAAIALLIAVLGFLSWSHCRLFDSAETLFTHNLELNPQAFKAHLLIGGEQERRGAFEEAAEHYQAAIAIEPRYAPNHARLALALVRMGRLTQALEASQRSLAMDANDGLSLNNHANIVADLSGPEAALPYYRQAYERRPGVPIIQLNYAMALHETGRNTEALERLGEYDHLAGATPHSTLLRGFVLHELGETERARLLLDAALREEPGLTDLLLATAKAHEARGRQAPALHSYRQLLLLAPDDLTALNNAAWILATAPGEQNRNGEEARRHAERVNTLTNGRNPGVLDTLAAARAEAGDFEGAIQAAREAVERARSQGNDGLAHRAALRLEKYEQGRPHRAP